VTKYFSNPFLGLFFIRMDNPCNKSAKLNFWFKTVLGMIPNVLFYVRIKTYTSAQDMGRKKKDRNERRRAERRGGGWR